LNPAETQLRASIAERLRARRQDIERSIATRVYAISEPPEMVDHTYLEGLRTSLAAALDFALAAVELGERRSPDVPPSLLVQAKMAARNGIGLDTVLRRYTAGYSLIVGLIVDEMEEEALVSGPALRRLLQGQAAVFDRLLEAVSEEHGRESDRLLGSSRRRRAERVGRLLSGELIDTAELEYDFDGFHLGIVSPAPDVEPSIRALASKLDLRPLCLVADCGQLWAWLGSPRPLDPLSYARAVELAEDVLPRRAVLALGAPGEGAHGWRLTHRQALAALSVAGLQGGHVVPYADVGLLACVSNNDLLRESLYRIYLAPLAGEPDGGEALLGTLEAYFAAGRNITSAAAILKVNRQTVGNRLRAFEQKLGRSLNDCAAELETALRLERRAGYGQVTGRTQSALPR
jgi:PucR C-terminal helix-turn-helix domain/GGDEF-like domain